ncbi:LysE family translocator [Brachybacterium sp. AOP25-B2-12]|uniref:LysE family translocator n=1 Tax=Brachybacterium sp. AOP25-B2-12 TaxID=3457710 RepID=UPI004034B99C
MSWAFVMMVVLVIVAPGVDLVMVLRSAVAGGRGAGLATVAGVCTASALQGALVALGVGTIVVRHQVVFETIRWLGIAYLAYLGITSVVSALRGREVRADEDAAPRPRRRRRLRFFDQGFTTNITNPKMFVFYLSLLPQFVAPDAPVASWLVHAWTLPVVGGLWLVVVALLAGVLREKLLRPMVRRVVDACAGLALLAFGVRLATER